MTPCQIEAYILLHLLFSDVHGFLGGLAPSKRVLPNTRVGMTSRIDGRHDTYSARKPRGFGAPVSPAPMIDEDDVNDRRKTGVEVVALFTGRDRAFMMDGGECGVGVERGGRPM